MKYQKQELFPQDPKIWEEEWQGIIDPASVEPATHLDYYGLVSRSELMQSGWLL